MILHLQSIYIPCALCPNVQSVLTVCLREIEIEREKKIESRGHNRTISPLVALFCAVILLCSVADRFLHLFFCFFAFIHFNREWIFFFAVAIFLISFPKCVHSLNASVASFFFVIRVVARDCRVLNDYPAHRCVCCFVCDWPTQIIYRSNWQNETTVPFWNIVNT